MNMIGDSTTSTTNEPVGGAGSRRHRRTSTIERFDPLYAEVDGVVSSKEKSAPDASSRSNSFVVSGSYKGTTEASSPDESREGGDTLPSSPRRETNGYDLTEELRRLAVELKKTSPTPVITSKPITAAAGGGKGSSKSSSNTPVNASSSSSSGTKKPWQRKLGRHRKTRSLASSSFTSPFGEHAADKDKNAESGGAGEKPTLLRASTATGVEKSSNHKVKHLHGPAAMIKDLWNSQKKDAVHPSTAADTSNLFVPSLAKPRPTSFLAFNESCRSSEQDASEWQVEIPEKSEFEVCAKFSQFLDRYRTEECLLDLQLLVGANRLALSQFASGEGGQHHHHHLRHNPASSSSLHGRVADFHQPVVESLLECAPDLVQVCGYLTTSTADASQDSRREVLILERQRQFVCVLRGTTPEQQGKFSRQAEPITLEGGVRVFSDRYGAFHELEANTFALLDKLTEESPFCDVVFTGHSFGAAMATAAAYRYASGRPELRVSALVTACPKVGPDEDFRFAVHASPNLKVVRLEYGHHRPQGNPVRYAGHTLRIHPAVGTAKSLGGQQPIRAYRFGDAQDLTPARLLFKREKDISEYVNALEDLDKFKENAWVKDFHREDAGTGVRGRDNEARQVV